MIIVGYGDMYLIFFGGKLVGIVCVVFGILIIVMLIVVVVVNFSEYYLKNSEWRFWGWLMKSKKKKMFCCSWGEFL